MAKRRQQGPHLAKMASQFPLGFPLHPPTPSPLPPDAGQAQLPLAGRPMGGGVTGSGEEWVEVTKGLLPPLRSAVWSKGPSPISGAAQGWPVLCASLEGADTKISPLGRAAA